MHKTRIAAVAALGAAGVGLAGFALPAGAQDPPGNNGTVKVDGVEFDTHPDNQPHVGCVFQVDFYGFDEGDLEASVSFELVPPTGGDELIADDVAIGEDAAGGGTDLDAEETYDLTDALAGVEPHPEQGWHVKLTIHAEGSQGADTKFKVFWVTGCETPPTTGSTTTTTDKDHDGSTTTSTTDKDHDGSTTTTEKDHGGGPGGPGSSTTLTEGGPGPGGPAPTTPRTTDVEGLAETGSNSTLPLTLGALALVGLGATAALWSRRLRADGSAQQP